jgi:hypothetical protein
MQPLVRTARATGVFYLGLAIMGGLGFLLIRGQLYVPDQPDATLAHLVDHESLARLGVAAEMGVVLTQALAAAWFYRLFRSVDTFAAGCLAAFGLVNAVAILVSAALLGTALDVALDSTLMPAGGAADAVQLMYLVSGQLWEVGALFFGLWLVPMGWLVLRSGWMPRPLGWILVGGGVGYICSAFLGQLAPDADVVTGALTLPATVGEIWMVGYLLVRGVNRRALEWPDSAPSTAAAP